MPTARLTSSTGPVELYDEETGQGCPLIWPGLFNQHVAELPAAVENGRWGTWKRAAR